MSFRRISAYAVAVFAVALVLGTASAERPTGNLVSVVIGFETEVNHDLLATRGVEVNHQFINFPAVTAHMTESAMKGLSCAPGVMYVHKDEPEMVLLSQTTPWGINRVQAPRFHHSGQTGQGVRVAVLDTGINSYHRDINVQGGINLIEIGGSWLDDNGHGTHVAGTIAALNNSVDVVGVAPGASLYSVKVADQLGMSYPSVVAAGIDWAVSNSMQVINMSFGFTSDWPVLEQSCQAAWNAGLVLVAAAGNDGYSSTGNIRAPARYPSVIAVGATNSSNSRASDSSTGPELELMAPGSNILSLALFGGVTSDSGTSMASPHVAGAAALLMRMRPEWSNSTVRAKLVNSAATIGNGDPHLYGNGLVNAYLAAPRLNVAVTTDQGFYVRLDDIEVTVGVLCDQGNPISSSYVFLEVWVDGQFVADYNGATQPGGQVQFTHTAHDSGLTDIVARAYHGSYVYGTNWVQLTVLGDGW